MADVTVAAGESLEINFQLNPIVTSPYCDEPNMPVPDNDPEGGAWCSVTDYQESLLSGTLVQVDIDHTYLADMIVELISPSGTIVRLHSNQGGSGDDLVGWYPTELTPFQSLDAFLGEPIQGDWLLHVTDVGPGDVGFINSWCLVLTYEQTGISAAGDTDLPQVLALDGNYPNPFNPKTVIKFSVPVAENVELGVYDVRGIRVRTLVSETMAAGRHEVTWMGRDDTGRTVSSGAYFYRLTSGGKSVVGKMLLMK